MCIRDSKKFPLYLRFPAGAEELLNTEAPCWGGADKSKPKALHTTDGGVYGRDYTLTVDLPAMGLSLIHILFFRSELISALYFRSQGRGCPAGPE